MEVKVILDEVIKGQRVYLNSIGTFMVNGKQFEWYKDKETGRVWIPRKRSSVISLVEQILND